MIKNLWRTFILAVTAASMALASCGGAEHGPAAAGPGWPQWRGPSGNGVSAETSWNPMALQGTPKVLWKKDVGTGYSSPSIDGRGHLFIMGLRSTRLRATCLDAATGRELWGRDLERTPLETQGTPATDGDRVYFLNWDGLLVCLKTSNGAVLWNTDVGSGLPASKTAGGWAASAVVEGNLLLLNANTEMMALDKLSGKLQWQIEDQVPVGSWGSYATPVVSGVGAARRAFFLGPSTLFAVDLPGGKVVWSFPHHDDIHAVADPIVSEGQVFISLPNLCFMLNLSSGQPSPGWKTQFTGWLPPPVLLDGYLYGSHMPPEFYTTTWEGVERDPMPFRCIDWKTGKVMWEKMMGHVTLIAAGDKLIMIELNGTLHVAEASPKGYTEIAITRVLADGTGPKTFAVPPVLYDGRLYCRNFNGELTCIDVSK